MLQLPSPVVSGEGGDLGHSVVRLPPKKKRGGGVGGVKLYTMRASLGSGKLIFWSIRILSRHWEVDGLWQRREKLILKISRSK